VLARAEQEATALATGGADGIIIENFHDAPFTRGTVDPAVVSAMSLAVKRIRQLVTLPIGINVLRNDAISAMAIACCTDAQFIRVNVLTGVTVTDQGLIEGCAYELLRYRRSLGVDVKIFADVCVKHGTSLSGSSLVQQAQETVERGQADGLIISGLMTSYPPLVSDLQALHKLPVPVMVGSGATQENVGQFLPWCDGVIVASSLKRHGQNHQPIDPTRVERFVEVVAHLLP
jgi:membrane complex biogenesis BtpA family protein